MSHEHDPKASGLEEIRAKRVQFAEKLAEMSIVPCDMEAIPLGEHPVIHFPHARRHNPDIAQPGEW